MCACVLTFYAHYVREEEICLSGPEHTLEESPAASLTARFCFAICVFARDKNMFTQEVYRHTLCKTQNKICQEKSINECRRTSAHTRTHNISHTYSLAHHLQATGLLFNIPEPPPTVKGAIERGPKPRRYKTQAGFLKQDVWLRPPSPQINNPQNLIFWRQGGSTRVTLFPHPVSWSSQGPGGVQPGSGAAVET